MSLTTMTQAAFGARLQHARITARLAVGTIADRMSLSPMEVEKVESGLRKVSTLEFARFCEAYGIEVTSFFEEEKPQTELVASARRSSDRSGADRTRSAVNKAFQIYYALHNLEGLLQVERPQAPARNVPDPKDRDEAIGQGRDAASAERARFGLGTGPVGDIIERFEDEGVAIAGARLHPDLSGIMLAQRDRFPMIVVNDDDVAWRRTFSIAHEYAHVLFDRFDHPGLISLFRAAKGDLLEVRANAFAAEFLMPCEALAETFGIPRRIPFVASRLAFLPEVPGLAARFGVSDEVVLRQAKQAGYVDEGTLRRLSASKPQVRAVSHRTERAKTKRRYLDRCAQGYLSSDISHRKFVEVASLVIGKEEAQVRAAALRERLEGGGTSLDGGGSDETR